MRFQGGRESGNVEDRRGAGRRFCIAEAMAGASKAGISKIGVGSELREFTAQKTELLAALASVGQPRQS